MKNIRKAYRIACIAVGKRKVHAALFVCAAAIAIIAYSNNFDLSATFHDIAEKVQQGKDLVLQK